MSRLLIGLFTLGLAVAGCQRPSTTPASASSESGTPVARWNGGSISAAELDAATWDQRKQALDQMLVRRLVEEKAKAEKITPEELYKREVIDKIKRPSEEDMKKFYDEQSKGRTLPPYEQVREQIVQYMERPATAAAQQAFVDRLRQEMKAEILIKPPRVEVAAEGPSRGPAGAPITIVEFSDFQCPYCSKAETTVSEVMKAYDGKVRLVYRDYPLPSHPQAPKAAEAAHCAGDQGKYWEMHEKLFAHQEALEPDKLKGYAKDLALDQARFDKCLDSGEKAAVVENNRKAGEKVGVTGTPAFFVNGYQLTGAQPFSEFKTLIDGELSKLAKK